MRACEQAERGSVRAAAPVPPALLQDEELGLRDGADLHQRPVRPGPAAPDPPPRAVRAVDQDHDLTTSTLATTTTRSTTTTTIPSCSPVGQCGSAQVCAPGHVVPRGTLGPALPIPTAARLVDTQPRTAARDDRERPRAATLPGGAR